MALVTDVQSRKARRKQERQARKRKNKHNPQEKEDEQPVESARNEPNKKRARRQEPAASNKDPYAHLDPDTADAMRRDDAEIAELEEKLGVNDTKERGRLHREFAKGYGDDFGDFLDGLDGMVQRVAAAEKTSGDEEDTMISSHEPPRKKSAKDPYAHLDAETAAAMRRDDEEIAELEAKMGLQNKKERKRLYREYAKLEGYGDDFGDFLDGLDDIASRVVQPDANGGTEASDSSSSEDEEEVPMKDPYEAMDEDDSLVDELERRRASDSDDQSSDDDSELDEECPVGGNSSTSDSEEEDGAVRAEPDHDVRDIYRPSQGEDIYGNVTTKEGKGATPQKYVPPHMRKQQQQDDNDENRAESLRQLQRALNNSLNRLSEDTLISVAQSLANLYPSYPTPDVNQYLWKNVMNACVSRPIVMSGMIPVYIACLTGVHIQTSDNVQLGGFLLEELITKLWSELGSIRSENADEMSDTDVASKEACNLTLVLCYLYNFGVAHCSLLFDVIRNYIDHFTEVDVELLLLILSHCGHALRSDDPSALKEIVLVVQKKALEAKKNGSRVEYMLSAMADLKNNKKRRQDQAFTDKTIKLRKLLGRIKSTAAVSGTGRYSDACLRMTLRDILDAESKGRWWKVGACWVGNQYNHKGDESDDEEKESMTEPSNRSTRESREEEEILKLASVQRMNTDVRRSIFCIIMGSEDCDDAFEKLVRAGMLKNRTERDTVRVLIECCGNEKNFNPFYAHLASRICEYQPQCKFTFQLAYWDTFKQFDKLKPRKAVNLAKLLFHLVAVDRSLRLNVLKVIDMSSDGLSENASIFLTVLFSNIFDTFEDPMDVVRLFPQSRPDVAMGSAALMESSDESSDALREGLSVFFLQTLKSSPKNKKGSKFRRNFKVSVKACEADGL